jgi:hypothetical protein
MEKRHMHSPVPNWCTLLFCIAGPVLIVGNSIWAFNDARRRGISGILVALLVLCIFPLGVLLWVVIRPGIDDKPKRTEDPDEELKRRANAGTL